MASLASIQVNGFALNLPSVFLNWYWLVELYSVHYASGDIIISGSQTNSHHSPLTTEDPLTNCTILWFQRFGYINLLPSKGRNSLRVYDAQYESSSSHIDVRNLAGTQSYPSQILNFPRLLKFGNALCLRLNVTFVSGKLEGIIPSRTWGWSSDTFTYI